MARLPRGAIGGEIYHVINRGNKRAQIFFCERDYWLFMSLIAKAQERIPMRLLSYCIMPNHWHLLLWPYKDKDMSRFMHWLSVTHTQRWHIEHQSIGLGHIYQGRFKSFPVQLDQHLITVARYVERNALRAKLVLRAEDWRWGSLFQSTYQQVGADFPVLASLPLDRPEPWIEYVNSDESTYDLTQIRLSSTRGRPLGQEIWVSETAAKLGILQSLRPRGRPVKGKGS